MKPTANPVEATLFHSYWDDGLLDLLGGLGLLGLGIAWAFDLPLVGVALPAILIPLWEPLRRRIVEPRAGYVEFSRGRQASTNRGLLLTLASGAGVLALVLAVYALARDSATGLLGARAVQGLPATLVAVLAVLTGLLIGARRFALYGVVLVLAATGTILLEGGPAAPMMIGGVVVLVSGAALMSRFLSASADYSAES